MEELAPRQTCTRQRIKIMLHGMSAYNYPEQQQATARRTMAVG